MPETETPVPPAKPGAVDPHSGRRAGGVETIEGGNQDAAAGRDSKLTAKRPMAASLVSPAKLGDKNPPDK